LLAQSESLPIGTVVHIFRSLPKNWANDLGEAVTHKKSMENLLID
jgi:hypothetical protein